MYGILGEDKSDVETLKVLIRRLQISHNRPIVGIRGIGYGGTGELIKTGAQGLSNLAGNGCTKFVISRDADCKNTDELRAQIAEKIIRPSGVSACICVLIPVQEIEAWLLADIGSASRIFTGWKPKEISNPESIVNPKEHLEKLSRKENQQPRYRHAVHNPKLAEHVDLAIIAKRCPSFRPLENLVFQGKSNL